MRWMDMRAGLGIIDITPPLGVELAGYGYYLKRQCDSVRDPLYARAVLLESGESRQLIVCFDLLGISQAVTDSVFRAAASLGVPRERTMIVSIHTHTGPAVKYHFGCGEVSESYVASLEQKMAPLLRAAEEDLADVTRLSFTRAPIPGDDLYNRSVPDGPVDRDARGFLLEFRDKAPILLANAACHGVFLQVVKSVSADFSGELHRLCAEAGIRSVYLNGLCGDIDPLHRTPERMAEFAALLFRILSGREAFRELPLTLSGGRLPFTLRLAPLSEEEIHEAAAGFTERAGGPDKPAAQCALAWKEELLGQFGFRVTEEPGDAAYCILGGIPILALPFEGFTAIGMEFRRLAGCEDALVLGCAEQLRGYLPTRDEYLRESYAAKDSTFLYRRLPPLPGEAERLAEQLAGAYAAIG